MIQYSALQYSVVQYNTELTCNVHWCITVQLSAVHDEVQDKFIFNSGGVSSNLEMEIIWKLIFDTLESFAE